MFILFVNELHFFLYNIREFGHKWVEVYKFQYVIQEYCYCHRRKQCHFAKS